MNGGARSAARAKDPHPIRLEVRQLGEMNGVAYCLLLLRLVLYKLPDQDMAASRGLGLGPIGTGLRRYFSIASNSA